MSEADFKTICILGRQPALGLAELERLYGAEAVRPAGSSALLALEPETVEFKRLGGVIKTGRVLAILPTTKWPDLLAYLRQNIPNHLKQLPAGKFTLGVSFYGLSLPTAQLNKDVLGLKKIIQASGRPARIVPNKTLELNSAQVLHNKLTSRGGWELLLVKDGQRTILAQTLFVQDIEAYAARDQARPARDARVGMLPPKLAQIMVNLAVGPLEQKLVSENKDNLSSARLRVRVLDPFCGTGVILQEALLAGYSALGTDIEPRMVQYSKTNIDWLVKENPQIQGMAVIEQADATRARWPGFSAIASEAYLGRPLATLPPPEKLGPIVNDVNTIISKFLRSLAGQIKPGRQICLAVPAWRAPGGQLTNLPLLAKLTDMGYNILDLKHVRHQDLIYFRENQVVARQLLILEKR
ncbi:MAG TPA: hypothetical protein VFP35_04345 [Candidatus Saccharimonadales bacterium]|nr:hypothetical protein [Candidatus Saccharimonadales bacterium]